MGDIISVGYSARRDEVIVLRSEDSSQIFSMQDASLEVGTDVLEDDNLLHTWVVETYHSEIYALI